MKFNEVILIQQNDTQFQRQTHQTFCVQDNDPYQKSLTQTVNDVPLQDDDSQDISELLAQLPGKVYENCQRTARVIMLTELEKLVYKSKKLKNELAKQLEQFLPKNNIHEILGDYTGKTGYFRSIHYSRVRIGQRSFIKNILLNPVFKDKFQLIFKIQNYQACQKARKNQNSQVKFQVRKKVINFIISDYKAKFRFQFSNPHPQNQNPVYQNPQTSEPKEEEKEKYQKQQQKAEEIRPMFLPRFQQQMHYILYLPLIPIPLTPSEYECYQQARLNGF